MSYKLTDLIFGQDNILDQFFMNARNIIWKVEVFFMNVYVFLIITLFFLIILAIMYLPVWLKPYYEQNKKFFDKILLFYKKTE